MTVRVARLAPTEHAEGIRAWVDLEFDGWLRVNEYKIIQKRRKPPFLAPPSRKLWEEPSGGYLRLAEFLTPEAQEAVQAAALAEWYRHCRQLL